VVCIGSTCALCPHRHNTVTGNALGIIHVDDICYFEMGSTTWYESAAPYTVALWMPIDLFYADDMAKRPKALHASTNHLYDELSGYRPGEIVGAGAICAPPERFRASFTEYTNFQSEYFFALSKALYGAAKFAFLTGSASYVLYTPVMP